MSNTITYGLVVQTVRNGHEAANVLKSVSGKYEDRYCCDYCSEYRAKDDLHVGTSWECVECGDYREVSGPPPDEDPMHCGETMARRDGDDHTLEGFLCPDCDESMGARIYADPTEFFLCDQCGFAIDTDEDKEFRHLYEHLDYAWE